MRGANAIGSVARCVFVTLLSIVGPLTLAGCLSGQRSGIAQWEVRDGRIIRGAKDQKRIAIVFTGHEYAEGAETILGELKRRDGHGSFFLTGTFLSAPESARLLPRLRAAGHYVGPHSDLLI